MKLDYQYIKDFPKLAWLSVIDTDIVTVYHGAYVETHSNFFVEGCWNGPFAKGAFSETDCIFGSGATIKDDEITLVSSAATTDCLYYTVVDNLVIAANSLPLLLAYTNDSLDSSLDFYEEVNDSIMLGISGCMGEIPTTNGHVSRLIYRNLLVNTNNNSANSVGGLAPRIELTDKWIPREFQNYQEYLSYLSSNYSLLVENIRDENRKHDMKILSTQSRGYDTTAVNAIAAKHGIDKVFTVTKAKGAGCFVTNDQHAQQNDDGTEICEWLGLECVPLDRRFFEHDFNDETLFYASLHKVQDANLLGLKEHISSAAVLLTGTLGEIWYRHKPYYEWHSDCINSELVRADLGCHGLTEFRLKSGFIQLPLPYIGARHRANILKITESAELEPWRTNNDYDRPIPRRIAEDAGIPREMFGQHKMATVTEFPIPPIPYNKQLRNEYFVFLRQNRLLSNFGIRLLPIVQYINTSLVFSNHKKNRLIYYFERAISKLIGSDYKLPQLYKRLNGSVFCFCVNKRISDYKAHLKSADLGK